MSAPLVGRGSEILSLHDHNFFNPDKHKYFHSGVEIVISLVVVVAFGNIHIITYFTGC